MRVSVEPNPSIYPLALTAWMAFLLFLFAFATNWSLSNLSVTDGFQDLPFVNQALIFFVILWVALSYHQIPVDELAAVTFLGYPVHNTGAGPKIYPWLLFQIHRFPRSVQQRQLPDDPEMVFKGLDNVALPTGMKRPLRITTGAPTEYEQILDVQMAIEFLFYQRVQIVDPLRFLIRYRDLEGYWQQTRDSGETALTRIVSKSPGVGHLIRHFSELIAEFDQIMRDLAESGGVDVIECGLNSPDLSHRLAAAIRDVAVASATATQSRRVADAEAYSIRVTGHAKAESEKAVLDAIAAALKESNDAAVAAYVGGKVLGDKSIVIGSEGISQAIGLAAIISEKARGRTS